MGIGVLEEWLKKAREEGLTDEDARTALRQKGYPDDLIENLLLKIPVQKKKFSLNLFLVIGVSLVLFTIIVYGMFILLSNIKEKNAPATQLKLQSQEAQFPAGCEVNEEKVKEYFTSLAQNGTSYEIAYCEDFDIPSGWLYENAEFISGRAVMKAAGKDAYIAKEIDLNSVADAQLFYLYDFSFKDIGTMTFSFNTATLAEIEESSALPQNGAFSYETGLLNPSGEKKGILKIVLAPGKNEYAEAVIDSFIIYRKNE